MKSIYINTEDYDTRVAIAEEGRLVNYFTEKNIYAKNGNIYKGRITKIVSNMNFVFVDMLSAPLTTRPPRRTPRSYRKISPACSRKGRNSWCRL